ncbi:MAG TPA: DUF485 domain-containing protein [Verrucomicrobiae bacterium]|jgi:uncharacterized membrane protein (DUF485 family)
MNPQPSGKIEVHSESFLHTLMRRQLKLSIACGATFLVALLALPLLNYFVPELMARRVFGFTLTWFILGVLFFPFVWIISWLFIRRSIALEEAEVAEVAGESEQRSRREDEKTGRREKGIE